MIISVFVFINSLFVVFSLITTVSLLLFFTENVIPIVLNVKQFGNSKYRSSSLSINFCSYYYKRFWRRISSIQASSKDETHLKQLKTRKIDPNSAPNSAPNFAFKISILFEKTIIFASSSNQIVLKLFNSRSHLSFSQKYLFERFVNSHSHQSLSQLMRMGNFSLNRF